MEAHSNFIAYGFASIRLEIERGKRCYSRYCPDCEVCFASTPLPSVVSAMMGCGMVRATRISITVKIRTAAGMGDVIV
jgi:hypothetical protein